MDLSGNISVCMVRVRVVDNIVLIFICRDVMVVLNSNGFVFYFFGIVVDKVLDNCSVLFLFVGVFNVNCDYVGFVRLIMIRVLDNFGN